MPQKNNRRAQMDEALKVFRVIFITDHQPAKVKQPGKEAFDLPPPRKPTQWTTVLRRYSAVLLVGRDQFRAVLLHQLFVQPVTVISFVPNQTLWHVGHYPRLQCGGDQFHFSRRSTFCPQGERKTMA